MLFSLRDARRLLALVYNLMCDVSCFFKKVLFVDRGCLSVRVMFVVGWLVVVGVRVVLYAVCRLRSFVFGCGCVSFAAYVWVLFAVCI